MEMQTYWADENGVVFHHLWKQEGERIWDEDYHKATLSETIGFWKRYFETGGK